MKGRWTEIFTRREKDIPGHVEASEGRYHGQGWACTCGCNKRIHGRKHSDGPPKDACADGVIVSTGGASNSYREGYERIDWSKFKRKSNIDWSKFAREMGKGKGDIIKISRVNHD